jgi:hypothetical protein
VDRGIAVLNGGAYRSRDPRQGSVAYARYGSRDAEPALLEQVRTIERLCAEAGIPMAPPRCEFSMRNADHLDGRRDDESPSGWRDAVARANAHPGRAVGRVESIRMTEDDPRADRW